MRDDESEQFPARIERRPVGHRHDLARAPTGIPHIRWVSRSFVLSVRKTQPRLGFFVSVPAEVSIAMKRALRILPPAMVAPPLQRMDRCLLSTS